jgi:hypothetical protein
MAGRGRLACLVLIALRATTYTCSMLLLGYSRLEFSNLGSKEDTPLNAAILHFGVPLPLA